MRRRQPEDAGVRLGAPLEDVGRARRWRCDDGAELWRMPAEDRAAAERLLELGRAGVGGFTDGGLTGDDEAEPWLLRRPRSDHLAAWLKDNREPYAWRDAVALVASLARALAACESRSLFVGALIPSAVALHDDEPWLIADGWVGALVGASTTTTAGTDSDPRALLWAPPEAVEDGRWSNAANRYALGVLLYRLLAGEHPYAGAGLRHALVEAQRSEPPPFAAAVGRALPPGLQSDVLAMLHPDADARPDSAGSIVELLQAHARGEAATARASREVDPGDAADTVPIEPPPARRSQADAHEPIDLSWLLDALGRRRGWRYLPLVVGLLVLVPVLATMRTGGRESDDSERPEVAPARPLGTANTQAGDCAGCHPTQAAEWSQSVMGHSVKSPLFNALEMLIEEQVGRDRDCPEGAGVLRRADPNDLCRDRTTGLPVTGAGGEHWCVNCHAPGDNLASAMPPWRGRSARDRRSRFPVRDLINPAALEGISCAFCHQVHGPVGPRGAGAYQGNPGWRSFATGVEFFSRPEDASGSFGIGNSGYLLDPSELLLGRAAPAPERLARGKGDQLAVHLRPSDTARDYLRSSEFCGSCHDVRLFGTDVLGAQRGEHFKRLRNAYSEWRAWAATERAAGRRPASCQDCHMSSYPGVCLPDEDGRDDGVCPDGTRFEAHEPGRRLRGRVAVSSADATAVTSHYFSGVDLPLARDISDAALSQAGLDGRGVPLSAKRRRNALLRRSFSFEIREAKRRGDRLEIPLEITNVGAGHKVPAGFSQEREIWVHLTVRDARGGIVYEVGRVDRDDEDLRDKLFLQVNTDPDRLDGQGRPIGLFGADVTDGTDAPRWSPLPELGGSQHRGRGLINFQNGFLRCVRCIGVIAADGRCQPGPGQGRHRADRFADGDYDIDTGECRSNLQGEAALFETYFPIGALDATRGLVKGPDAIIDTRSLPAGKPRRYVYELRTGGRPGPFRVEARLMFRGFPPFLLKAFAAYEQRQATLGKRPSGPLLTRDMLDRLERVEVAKRGLVIP